MDEGRKVDEEEEELIRNTLRRTFYISARLRFNEDGSSIILFSCSVDNHDDDVDDNDEPFCY